METDELYVDRMFFKEAFTGGSRDDPPLLKELGIDFSLIKTESLLPIKVLSRDALPAITPSDITGPFTLVVLFTFSLILHGKIHFGYIYIVSLFSLAAVYFLLNLLSPHGVPLVLCCSILGYSFVPVLFFSFFDFTLRWFGLFLRLSLGLAMAFWSAYTATVSFCRYVMLTDKSFVVAYPVFLAYLSCIILIIF